MCVPTTYDPWMDVLLGLNEIYYKGEDPYIDHFVALTYTHKNCAL